MDALRTRWAAWGFESKAIDLALMSHTLATHRTYDVAWSRWLRWCAERMVEPSAPAEMDVANFGASLHETPGASKREVLSAVRSTLELLTKKEAAVVALHKGMALLP